MTTVRAIDTAIVGIMAASTTATDTVDLVATAASSIAVAGSLHTTIADNLQHITTVTTLRLFSSTYARPNYNGLSLARDWTYLCLPS